SAARWRCIVSAVRSRLFATGARCAPPRYCHFPYTTLFRSRVRARPVVQASGTPTAIRAIVLGSKRVVPSRVMYAPTGTDIPPPPPPEPSAFSSWLGMPSPAPNPKHASATGMILTPSMSTGEPSVDFTPIFEKLSANWPVIFTIPTVSPVGRCFMSAVQKHAPESHRNHALLTEKCTCVHIRLAGSVLTCLRTLRILSQHSIHSPDAF